MVKGVIFDFNGVIVDDYPIQKEAWDHMSRQIRKREVTDFEMIHNIRGVPARDTLSWMSGNALDLKQLDELVKEKEAIVRKLFIQSPLFCLNKGLPEFLDELKSKNVPRTVATSSTLDDVKFAFNRLGLNEWFDIKLVVYNDGSLKGKPAPDSYLKAASRLNLSPQECVIIEDAAAGIKAAYASGCTHIVAIGSDDRLDELKQLPGIMLAIHDFTELKFDSLDFA